mmetsp:Transcript_27715/g.70629  ORF Transcript_27715/g.70629 Transcript_27715/m.70629 type:complete len:221 (+) Transcript_27715:691-1353(+)
MLLSRRACSTSHMIPATPPLFVTCHVRALHPPKPSRVIVVWLACLSVAPTTPWTPRGGANAARAMPAPQSPHPCHPRAAHDAQSCAPAALAGAGPLLAALGAANVVVGVQQVVRGLAQGSSQELGVQLLDERVLVRPADVEPLVQVVHGRLPLLQDLLVGGAGLAAAADAAAGARHDLDKVVVHAARLEVGDDLLGVAQTVGHRDLDVDALALRVILLEG